MNQYSQMVGSFFRTGDYPIEANYIFETVDKLKEFYSDELQKATLHKGLLKIVEDDNGKQALYWVTKKQTNDELEFTHLISGNSVEELLESINSLEEKLAQEIEDRKLADDAIYGTGDKTELPDDLNSLLDLSEAVSELKNKVQQTSDQLKAVVGTEQDDIIAYLETLDYHNLTEVSKALHHFLNTIDEEDASINTLPELKEFLRGFEYTHNLYQCFVDFWNAIQGDPTPNTQFRTLRGIQDFVEALASVVKNRCDNLQTELDQTQVGVGLSGDGSYNSDQETYYLKNATSVMNALKILDSLINEAINNVNLQPGETDTVNINIVKEKEKTTIYADVKLSKETGNDILTKSDGLYHRVDTEYLDGVLTVRVNGEIRQQHILGLSMIVDSAQYDPAQEAIIIVFKLQSGDTQKVVIPAGALISEWEVDNSQSDKVVELHKERITGAGADKLSADVRLSSDKYNILKKDGNALLVDGRADNIVYDGDITVKSKLDQLQTINDAQDTSINKLTEDLTTETHNREIAEQDIKNEADKLKARVEINETNISNLQTQVPTLESGLQQEINDRTLADQDLQNKIDALNTRVDNNDSKTQAVQDGLVEVNNKLEQEIKDRIAEETRATAAEADLQNQINTANTNIQQNAENISTLQSGLRSEIDRATAEEQAIKDLIRDTEHIYNGTKSIHFDKQGNIVTADVKIAGGDSNIIKVDNTTEGIYATVDIGYNAIENKIWLVTSGGTTKEVQLSEGHVIDDIYYDVNEKSLVVVFTANGIQKTTKFPVSDLFNDWTIVNPTENSAIELTKVHNVKDPSSNDTPDTLSARLLIADVESNAAQIIGNGLFVSNKETVANTKAIEELQTKQSDLESNLNSEIDRAKTVESELNTNIQLEVTRATGKEDLLDQKIESTKSDLTIKIDANSSKISELDSYTRTELAKKLESVQLIKNDDLSYTILVDGISIGVINIPKDQFLQDVSLNGNVLHFVFVTTDGYSTTDIDFTQILKDALDSTIGDVSNIKTLLDQTVQNLNDEITRATHREDLIEKSIQDLQGQANTNTSSIEKINESIIEVKLKNVEQDAAISNITDKINSVETNITDNINSQIGNLSDKLDSEIERSTNKDNEFTQSLNNVTSNLNSEIVRAQAAESTLQVQIDTNDKLITERATKIESDLANLKSETNAALDKKINSVEIQQVDSLNYLVLVDGLTAGTISIPKDKYLESVELIGSILRFVFNRDSDPITDIDLSPLYSQVESTAQDIRDRLNNILIQISEEISRAKMEESRIESKLDTEIVRATQQEQFTAEELHHHMENYDNPHHVTADQLGVYTEEEVDEKLEEVKDSIEDLKESFENVDKFVIIKGYIELVTQLPEDPANHDKYVLKDISGGSYNYVLFEYNATTLNWQQTALNIGSVVSDLDKNVWKLNSTGPERMLDASDYKYFYNKIYDETKDLIEDIDWEEDDKDDTNGQIRLKITYKTKYGNPDTEGESEVTNPYQAKAVKYIDIDKARFLANAYSRPATQEDIDKGYASTLGEPMLILVFTTGDYVAIRLNELINIYDEIDTDSVDLTVTDWTGNKDTSYKISANLNIATVKEQENSISLHINSGNDKGLYGVLHTQTTNSIALNPSTGTSGQKYLTADLKIDNALNNVNDILLSISSSGLSAQLVIGEYD